MRVVVFGGRKYRDRVTLFATLDAIHEETPITLLIEGGAPGADRLGKEWAVAHGILVEEYKAAWDDLQAPNARPKKREDGSFYNEAAGYDRNLKMLVEGNPDIAVEFPGGPGTTNMRRLVQRRSRSLKHIRVSASPSP